MFTQGGDGMTDEFAWFLVAMMVLLVAAVVAMLWCA